MRACVAPADELASFVDRSVAVDVEAMLDSPGSRRSGRSKARRRTGPNFRKGIGSDPWFSVIRACLIRRKDRMCIDPVCIADELRAVKVR